jgi:RNA polymerase sigma-70 factor, ECF subfamily
MALSSGAQIRTSPRDRAGGLAVVITVEIVDDNITNFYAIRNPDKPAAIAAPRIICR